MDVLVVIEPAGHVLDIERRVVCVVHRALARLSPIARDRSPAAVRQHLGKAAVTHDPNPVAAPPLPDLGDIRCPGSELEDAPHAACELDEAGQVVGGRMVVSQLSGARGLGHHPLGLGVVVVPPHVVDHVRRHVHHPSRRRGVDRVDGAQRPAGGDLLDLGVVNAVAVLVADHCLHAAVVDQLLDGHARGARVRHRLLEGDQLRPTVDADLDELLAHVRHRAETEHVRLQR